MALCRRLPVAVMLSFCTTCGVGRGAWVIAKRLSPPLPLSATVTESLTVDSGGTVKLRLAGLGILQVRKRAARMGRNPATGEAIKIKASKKVAFRAAKELKMAV
jgi:nucleoid DNA-binding protein